jgi:hypothetical protein
MHSFVKPKQFCFSPLLSQLFLLNSIQPKYHLLLVMNEELELKQWRITAIEGREEFSALATGK